MKAQILKIAGVKTEAEFYKKYPTEEAFMKKHGKQLKKADPGAVIKPTAMPKVEMANLAKTKGFGLTKLENIPASTNRNYNYTDAVGMGINALPQVISGISGIIEDQENLDKSRKYAKLAKLVASAPEEELPQRQYVRPEDILVDDPNKYGIAQNGAMVGGNPTEIQNMYNSGDIYSDLGYEPLNSNNPKQYQVGGSIDYSTLTPLLGNFASGVGSYGGGGGFKQGNVGNVLSAVGGVAGTAAFGPVGGMVGSTVLGLIGGGFDAAATAEQEALTEERDTLFASNNFGKVRQQKFGAHTKNGGSVPSYENGGYMNPEYNPQVIAKFGDYSMDQLLAPPKDADMLRSGGHLAQVHYTPPSAAAMYTGRDLPYQMKNGGQMAMSGDLKVHRGKAETLSYNPFLPDGGETIMFRGPSHDNGGMPVSYGNNGVEVEGGEPAIKLQDGGSPDGNLVVYGNMVIPDYGVAEIGDKNAKGKKFKHYIDDLSKIEAKQNKLVDKTTTLINDADTNYQFDKLSLNTGQANLIGATMKLKEIAEKKKTAAAVQNAILDTASENGLESDALAKGKIKYAKANDPYAEFGAKLSKAQTGDKVTKSKYDPEFENFINQAMQLEQTNSLQANNYRGGGSYFGTNDKTGKIKTTEQAKDFYYKNYWPMVKDLPAGLRTRALQMAINTGDPYGELLVAGKEMTVEQRRKLIDDAKKLGVEGLEKNKFIQSGRLRDNKENIAKVVESYKKDPEAFLANLDAEQNRYYDSLVQANKFPDSFRNFYTQYTDLARNSAKGFIPSKQSAATQAASTPVATPATKTTPAPVRNNYSVGIDSPIRGAVTLSPNPETQPGAYIPNLKDQIINAKIAQMEEGNKMLDDVRVVAPKIDPSLYYPNGLPDPNEALQYAPGEGPDSQQIVGQFPIRDFVPSGSPSPSVFPVNRQNAPDTKKSSTQETSPAWMNALASVMPYLRPSNQTPLDPSQLAGEMYAMATNKKQPVFAQTYTPDLSQPTRISLQDQLNQITSQSRSAERMAQNNPAALAMIASQAAEAKNRVLGEQFRMNQGEQQRAMETNRQTINDARLKNLGIRQDQADKMAAVDVNTRKENQAILNSISAKILQNKSENKQLAVAENMYNYRFDAQGRAYNVNAPYNWNMSGQMGSSKMSNGMMQDAQGNTLLPDYNPDGTIKSYMVKKTARNGSIVKAIKGL